MCPKYKGIIKKLHFKNHFIKICLSFHKLIHFLLNLILGIFWALLILLLIKRHSQLAWVAFMVLSLRRNRKSWPSVCSKNRFIFRGHQEELWQFVAIFPNICAPLFGPFPYTNFPKFSAFFALSLFHDISLIFQRIPGSYGVEIWDRKCVNFGCSPFCVAPK